MYHVPVYLRLALVPIAVVSLFAAAAHPQPPADDAASTLERTRQRLLADLDRLPRYTCVQTITRKYYRPQSEAGSCSGLIAAHEKRREPVGLRGWDRLRLEVAIVEGTNVYSWVNAPRFENDTLQKIAGNGPLSSGDFGPFLHAIFTAATIAFKGEEASNGRRLFTYSYDLPVDRSRYVVRTDTGLVPTAYHGELVLNAAANDIASLTVETAELPEGNPDCQAISEVEYSRIQIHDRPILIPKSTRLITIDRHGGEAHSTTEYTSCREYAAKSRLFLDSPVNSTNAAVTPSLPPPATLTCPPGLHFHARIMTRIDSSTAAAGDPIDAVLRSPLRTKNGLELAPAGAHLRGRLLAVEERAIPLDVLRLLIQFDSIDLRGMPAQLRATPDSSVMIGISVFRTPVTVAPDDSSPEVTALVFRKPHVRLDKFDWSWTSMAPSSQAGSATH